MVASADGDLYTPFPQSSSTMPDESNPSSEEGSGLHSPVFGVQYHGDSNLRYQPEQVDIQNAAGILASQFDYNGLSGNMNVQQGPLLDATLDPGSGHHRSTYPSDFPLPPRSQLGLDIPVHSLSNTRLPPPPTQGGQVFFSSSSDRHYPAQDSAHGANYSSSGMPMDGGHQPSSSSGQPPAQTSTGSNNATSTEGPRKESSGVVIACRQCRARKIRCDSTRPVCNNCVRRSNECQYDAAPKRRGPDKRPGTRQRSCKKRPSDGSAPPPPSKRKRSGAAQPADNIGAPAAGIKENMASMKSTFPSTSRPSVLLEDVRGAGHMHGGRLSPPNLDLKPPRGMEGQGMFTASSSPSSRRGPMSPYDHDASYKSFRPLDVNIRQADLHEGKSPSVASPSLEYSRKPWFESLLDTYSPTREESLEDIGSDLSSLFSTSGYWLSFINVDAFMRTLFSPEEQPRMQPALVYAGLALATLMKSSELELGAAGRTRAVWLRDAAQTNLEQSLANQWIDLPLAEAALMLALFESSAHPQYHPSRAAASINYLDSIIRRLQLTVVDNNDPDVSSFKPHHVPSVKTRSSLGSKDSPQKCSCIPLPPNANLPADHYSSTWSYAPPWDNNWTPHEAYKEECRRLCWSALTIVAGYSSQLAAFDKEPSQFFLTDPGNYALLFPGEVSDRTNHRSGQSPKDSVWALYCRSMLLWSFSTRLGNDSISDSIKAEYAYEVWGETQSIQDALDAHVCNLDTALLYMCREYLYNTRVTVTRTLRSLRDSDSGIPHQPHQPVFSRKEAEEWLYYQDQVIKRVKSSINHLGEAQGHLLTRRPFQVTWFSSQLAICLSLWNNDRSLATALELAKSVLILVDIQNSLWPCPVQQTRCDELRKRLSEACTAAGVTQPLPPDFSLPPILKAA